MKCPRCKGLGGGYETCEGYYPNLIYSYVEIGECVVCEGSGAVDDFDDDFVDFDSTEPTQAEKG